METSASVWLRFHWGLSSIGHLSVHLAANSLLTEWVFHSSSGQPTPNWPTFDLPQAPRAFRAPSYRLAPSLRSGPPPGFTANPQDASVIQQRKHCTFTLNCDRAEPQGASEAPMQDSKQVGRGDQGSAGALAIKLSSCFWLTVFGCCNWNLTKYINPRKKNLWYSSSIEVE